ncbi:MAG: LysM peptidoglycan-binding domain-containing protein [Dehalococcoidia bacterium]
MNTQKQIFLIVVLFFAMTAGCAAYTVIELPIRAEDQIQWHEDQSLERGALLYANNCRTCHGNKGEGGVGPTLNKPEFQNQDPLVLRANRALLLRTLQCGRAGTRMPAWLNTNGGALNERQVGHLVNLITSPPEDEDESGNAVSHWWEEADHFAHTLNHELAVVVGGDTLSTIASSHEIGIDELVKLNGGTADAVLKKGSTIRLPDGRAYKIRKDRETLRKIADGQAVGAKIIADLNGIPIKVEKDTGLYSIGAAQGLSTTTGLIPFVNLKLPEGTRYTLRSGDTLESVARIHGVNASDIERLNPNLPKTADGKALDVERKLVLPETAVVVVAAGQTVTVIAQQHGLTVDALIAANQGLLADTPVGAGQQLNLPKGARYTIQTGDTVQTVARAHNLSAADLARLNNIAADAHISSAVVIALPKVDKYTVQGQTLEDIAKTYSNVTADSLAKAQTPPAQANSLYAIGAHLVLPKDAWGTAPPDAINNGSACVEHAVPASKLPLVRGDKVGPPAAPTTVTKELLVEAHANDWTFTADGAKQEINKGVALLAKGTKVKFQNVVGLHTITIAGKKDGADIKGTDSREFTFNDAGTFQITCDYHPDMSGYVFVQ